MISSLSHNNPTTAGLFGLFARSASAAASIPPQQQEPTGPGTPPGDTVEISERSRQLLAAETATAEAPTTAPQNPAAANTAGPDSIVEEGAEETSDNPQELSEEEQEQVNELKDRDREVRAHEQAHLAAAGGYARGGPTYEYQHGPDGKRYAVGGHVSIDTSPVPNDPEGTIRKAQVIRRAANAPAEPSSQDRSVAAEASRMESEARRELSEQQREASTENTTGIAVDSPDAPTDSATDAPSSATTAPAINTNAQTTPISTTAPGRFGRSSAAVGQLLQLDA